MKYFCFRFDVDTHKCLRDGVPLLLTLAKELDVKFTFFINFGQAVHRPSFIKSIFSKTNKKGDASLSALTKLGIKDYFYLSLFNPYVGKKYFQILENIQNSGHEIGLHGGKNHETWLRYANTWNSEEIRGQLNWGLDTAKGLLHGRTIKGFASPGWNGSEKINDYLRISKFLYVADVHTDQPLEMVSTKNNLRYIPTNITGGETGIAYLEHCRAKRLNDRDILNDFTEKLNQRKRLATVYDHPYFAAIKELRLVKEMIQMAKSKNYNIVTMHDIATKL